MNKDMNNRLKSLYETYWENYKTHFINKVDAAFPYLIYVPEKYEKSSIKVMFCGQETQSWNSEEYGDPLNATVESVMYRYNVFVNNDGYNSPYWNFQKRIINRNKNVGFIRNNIVKIGKLCDPGCDDTIDAMAREYFPVFKKELEILKPDLIIFLTGPNYDWRIRNTIGDFSLKHLGDPNECYDELIFVDSTIPKSVRINHPRSLQQNSKYWPMIENIDKIIKKLS